MTPEPVVKQAGESFRSFLIGSGALADEIFLNRILKKGVGKPLGAEKSGGGIQRGFGSQESGGRMSVVLRRQSVASIQRGDTKRGTPSLT